LEDYPQSAAEAVLTQLISGRLCGQDRSECHRRVSIMAAGMAATGGLGRIFTDLRIINRQSVNVGPQRDSRAGGSTVPPTEIGDHTQTIFGQTSINPSGIELGLDVPGCLDFLAAEFWVLMQVATCGHETGDKFRDLGIDRRV
jgi:hypothetical protein